MAEQKAGADYVATAPSVCGSAEQSGCLPDDAIDPLHGESLLLPLLQGLLDKKSSPRCYSSQSSEEGAPVAPVEDSGTESGEDLRFLAAGLSESIVMHRNEAPVTVQAEPLGDDLLQDVQSALTRLQSSLCSGGADCTVEPERKAALLQLVSRLQESLTTPEVLPTDETHPKKPEIINQRYGHKRFPRRRNRQERHTVGVCGEDLAKARMLIADVGFGNTSVNDNLNINNIGFPQYKYSLVKQTSAGEVLHPQIRHPLFNRQTSSPVRNTVAKPYQSENTTLRNEFLYDSIPGMSNLADIESSQLSVLPEVPERSDSYRLLRQKSGPNLDISSDSILNPPILMNNLRSQKGPGHYDHGFNHTENEPEKHSLYSFNNLITPDVVTENNRLDNFNTSSNSTEYSALYPSYNTYDTENELKNKRGQDYTDRDISSAQRLLQIAATDNPLMSTNKFNNKKFRLKRTYTIDMSKATDFGQNDSDLSDDDEPHHLNISPKQTATGILSIGKTKHVEERVPVPTFKPKTENDHKFLAFLNRQNKDTSNKPGWIAPKNTTNFQPKKQHNWNNCFGNIKHAFEINSEKERSASANSGQAQKFWKNMEIHANQKELDIKQKKQGNAYLKNIFEKGEKISKLPWTGSKLESPKIIKGFLQVKAESKVLNTPKLNSANLNNVANEPQPLINKFSHAPMSAFKPLPKKSQHTNNDLLPNTQPIFYNKDLYIDKQMSIGETCNQNSKQHSSAPGNVKSPLSGLPWAGTSSYNKRVLNLAASKFEQPQQNTYSQAFHVQRDRVQIPASVQQALSHTNKSSKQNADYNILSDIEDLSSPNIMKKNHTKEFNASIKVSIPSIESSVTSENFPSYTYTYTDYTQPSSVSTYVPILTSESENINSRSQENLTEDDTRKDSKPPKLPSISNSKPVPVFHTVPPTPEDISLQDMKEYVVSSKVMTGPVMQQATTVAHKMSHVGGQDERNSEAAINLKSALKKISSSSDDSFKIDAKVTTNQMRRRFSNDDIDHKIISDIGYKMHGVNDSTFPVAPHSGKFTSQAYNEVLNASSPSIRLNNYPISTHVYENNGESVLSSKLQIPKNRYNLAVQNSKNTSLDDLHRIFLTPSPDSTNEACTPRSSPINKNENWFQKMQTNHHKPPSPRPSGGRNLQKAKSSHTLAVPKQFEAGISRDEVDKKQKAVEAYFGNKSPQPVRKAHEGNLCQDYNSSHKQSTRHSSYQSRKSSINRTRTSEKSSAQYQNYGLARSQTMPHMAANEVALLDESNVEDAFEDLFNSSLS